MTEKEAIKKLKPKLTDEFLNTLVNLAKVIGWQVDYVEIESFIIETYCIIDKEVPKDLKPFCEIEGNWDDYYS